MVEFQQAEHGLDGRITAGDGDALINKFVQKSISKGVICIVLCHETCDDSVIFENSDELFTSRRTNVLFSNTLGTFLLVILSNDKDPTTVDIVMHGLESGHLLN